MKDYLDKDLSILDDVVFATTRGFKRGKVKNIGQLNLKVIPLDCPTKIIDIAPFKVIKI